MPQRKERKPGSRIGQLTLLQSEGVRQTKSGTKQFFRFKCDCGKEIVRTWGSPGRSCGCKRNIAAPHNGMKKSKSMLPGQSEFNRLFSNYRWAAKKRDIEFSLSKEEFRYMTKQTCYYCEQEPSQIMYRQSKYGANGGYLYNGVDRLDNSEGYTTNNSVPCCGQCNKAKRVLGEQEFYLWVEKVYKHLTATGRIKESDRPSAG